MHIRDVCLILSLSGQEVECLTVGKLFFDSQSVETTMVPVSSVGL